MRQIFLDTETTGLSPESGDRIIEIGCVELVNRRLTGRKIHFYVNPERRNATDAYAVHGLSDEFLGYLTLDMTMGQWLCVPMIVAGVALWLWGRGRAPAAAAAPVLRAEKA